MPFEPITINVYGDTAMHFIPSPSWKEEYLRYLAGRCDAHVTEYMRRLG